ncbi:MAG: hypothetical protein JW984_09760 [Deltaproteobacteria bacterium]|uniref:DUF3108 domain-containing protein n=1 Tax=Candidatus Zymogenus saltonus TaxID=2844893 RepID=A0A9D8PMS3_9DELT|nr:hypothetical protein [Candidatus Zymogenus saltonus]
MKKVPAIPFLSILILSFCVIAPAAKSLRVEELGIGGGKPSSVYNDYEKGEPFDLAWRISYRDKDIGYSISRFSSSSGGELKEDGVKKFIIDLGVITVLYSERTSTTWNGSGLIVSFTSTIDVNGSVERRLFRRDEMGTGTLKIIKGNKIKEVSHAKDEFDFISGDLYLRGFQDRSGDVTYRIMSLIDGKINSNSCTFIGMEKVNGTKGTEECAKIDIKGKKGGGIFLINDIGIAVYFKVQFPLGHFSFTPVDLAEAEKALMNKLPSE